MGIFIINKIDSKTYFEIFEALKEKGGNTLRKKLVDNDNPTAIIAALKLYGNDEDRLALISKT